MSSLAESASRFDESRFDELLNSRGFLDDPYPLYRRLREEHPVYWSDRWGVWVVSRFEDVRDILKDPRRFSSVGRFGTWLDQLPSSVARSAEPLRRFGEAAFNIDPPVHTRVRRLLRDEFTADAVEKLRPGVEVAVDRLLDGADPTHFDVVRDFALRLPISVISELIGATADEAAPFEDWAASMPRFLASGSPDAEAARQAGEAMSQMEAHFAGMIEERQRGRRDDLISRLLFAPVDEPLRPDELTWLAIELMIAGHLATKDLIGNAVITLQRDPESRQVLQGSPDLIPNALEEVLRFESPIQRGWRRATEDVEVNGQSISAGQLVFLLFGSANRDPEAFPDPDRFDVRRDPKHPNRHVAFGYGIHLCIGAPLARLEAPVAVTALLHRAPNLDPVTDVDWYPSIHVRGPRALSLRLT